MGSSFDYAFSDTVKQIQARKGSRDAYARMASNDAQRTMLNHDLNAFISRQKSMYLGTSSADGQPYIQHRGGPPGFIKIIDNKSLGFTDFKGNQQFISQGNLVENPKAFIFLMDYSMARRLKLWGEARVVENDEALNEDLMPTDYKAKVEQAIIFDIKHWDLNCRQHIPHLVEWSVVADEINKRDQRIAELEAKINPDSA